MFMTVNGKDIHYTDAGQGDKSILLVHGWGGTGRSLQQLATLLSRNYRVLTIDLPGFGSSSNPDPSWGTKEYAFLLADFIKRQSSKPVMYCGHSFGGALGVYLAANQPELISSLVLIAASYHRTTPKTNRVTSLTSRLPLPGIFKLFLRKILYKLFYPRSDILNYPHLEGNYRQIVRMDLTKYASFIKIPTLILWGENDRDTPVSDAYILAEKISGSKLVTLPGVTHNLPLKHAEAVYREVEKFL